MDNASKILGDTLLTVWEFILFILVSALFLPAFFIVTFLQKYWTKKLEDVFGL